MTVFRLTAPPCPSCAHSTARNAFGVCPDCGCASHDPAPTRRHTSAVRPLRRLASTWAERGWVRTLLTRPGNPPRSRDRSQLASKRAPGRVNPVSTRPRSSSSWRAHHQSRGRVDHLRWTAGTLAGILILAVAVSVANGQGFGPVEFLLTLGAGAYLMWAVGIAR